MISVIIPVYNVEQYIVRCLRSVTKQDFVRDMECIIVDDCSTDDSMQLVLDFVKEYQGPILFRTVHHKVNRGLSAARNSGTKAVSNHSKWIYYLDSDDEMKGDCLQTLILLAARYPQAEILCGNTLTLPNNKDEKWRDISFKKGLPLYIDKNEVANQYFFNVKNVHNWIPVNAWNKLISTEFIQNNSLLFCEGLIHEDEMWMFDVMKCVKSIALTTKRTYIHYQNVGSITKSGQEKRSCLHRIAIARWEAEHLDKRYRDIQIGKIFFQLADVYERALTQDSDFRRKVRKEICEIADITKKSLPMAFKVWFNTPPHSAHAIAPIIRKILIS